MQLRCKLDELHMQFRYKLDVLQMQFRYSLDDIKILFRLGVNGWEDESKNKTNLSQRLVEVEAELGNIHECSSSSRKFWHEQQC